MRYCIPRVVKIYPKINKKRGGRDFTAMPKESPVLGARYIFVGGQGVPFAPLRRVHMITGILCVRGNGAPMPVIFPTESMARLIELDQSRGGAYIPRLTTIECRKSLQVGDRITTWEGPLAGRRCTITRIVGRDAEVTVDMLGASRLVRIPLKDVESA